MAGGAKDKANRMKNEWRPMMIPSFKEPQTIALTTYMMYIVVQSLIRIIDKAILLFTARITNPATFDGDRRSHEADQPHRLQ
jgi:hypothetical protein